MPSRYRQSAKPMMPEPHRAMAQVGVARLGGGVEVDVDHVVEHAHGGLHRPRQLGLVELAVLEVGEQIDRAQVADGGFGIGGVEGDLGAQVGAVHDAHVLLRRTQVARDP
jgi:hypothetical protein